MGDFNSRKDLFLLLIVLLIDYYCTMPINEGFDAAGDGGRSLDFDKNDPSASIQDIDTGFRSRKATSSSHHHSHQGSNPAASMTSIRLRVNRSVNQSVQSIRDGYQHSRRTKQLYPVHDLPRRPSAAN